MALDIGETLAHIDRKLPQHARTGQENRFAPWLLAIVGMGTGAALFATGVLVGAMIR